MPISPFISLFPGTTAAGAGAGAGAAGAAAGTAGLFGVPWSIALPVIVSVLGATGIFGGKDPEEEALEKALLLKQQMKTLGVQQPYQSPFLPQIDQAVFQALINQMRRTANWGWPAGMQMDTSWLDDLLGRGLAARPLGQRLRRVNR